MSGAEATRWRGLASIEGTFTAALWKYSPAAVKVLVEEAIFIRAGRRVVNAEESTATVMHRSSVDTDDDDEVDREEHEEVSCSGERMPVEATSA